MNYMNEGEQLARTVATERRIAASLKAIHKANMEKMLAEYNAKWEEMLNELTRAEAAVIEAEAALRERTVAEFLINPKNKRPLPGASIRMVKTVKYDDSDALLWALDHKVCLSLDKRAFEAQAKAVNCAFMPAEIIEEPKASLDSDMSDLEDKESIEFTIAKVAEQ